MTPVHPRAGRGLAITELMVAVLVVSIVAIGLGGLMTTALRSQARGLKKNQVRMEMMVAAAQLNRDVYESHAIFLPLSGAEGDALEGYVNRVWAGAGAAVKWLNASTLDQTGTYKRFYHCLDASGQWLHRSETFPIAVDPPAIAAGACGQGAGWETLVRSPRRVAGRTPAGNLFSRAGGRRAHMVEIAADISDATVDHTAYPFRLNLASRMQAAAP